MAANRPLTTVPTSLKQALMAPDHDLWIDAIFKEISGLKEKVVWEEVYIRGTIAVVLHREERRNAQVPVGRTGGLDEGGPTLHRKQVTNCSH